MEIQNGAERQGFLFGPFEERGSEMTKLSEETLSLMEQLTQASGISGQEKYVTRILKPYYEKYCDEVVYDNLGSIYGIKRSKRPNAFRVLLTSHCDEVGMIVKGVNANGTLNLAPMGGVMEDTLPFKEVVLTTHSGKQFKGCICSQRNPKSSGNGGPALGEMVLEIGFTSEEQVRAAGVMEGDMVTLDGEFSVLGDGKRLMAKAWDSRYGCVLGVELLEAIRDTELPYDIVVGASVQQKVGAKGAKTAVNLLKPDMVIAFDCVSAPDLKGYSSPNGGLGRGVTLRFMDPAYLANRTLLLDYLDVVQRNDIPHQWLQAAGGTPAGALHTGGTGIPALTVGICARNLHTNTPIIDVDDYLNTKRSVLVFLAELDEEKLERYRADNR